MFGRTLTRALTLATVLSLLLSSVAFADQFQTDRDVITTLAQEGALNLELAPGGSTTVTVGALINSQGGASQHVAFPVPVSIAESSDAHSILGTPNPTSGSIADYYVAGPPQQNLLTTTVAITAPTSTANCGATLAAKIEFTATDGADAEDLTSDGSVEQQFNLKVTGGTCDAPPPPPADTTAPGNGSISINDGASWTNAPATATVDISATDNTGIVKYRFASTQAALATAADVAVSPAQASFSASNLSFALTGGDGMAHAWVRFFDAAGNSVDASDTIGVDTVAPTITGSTGTYTPGTWTNQSVTVSFSCTDNAGGSGIATDTVAGTTLTGSGADQSVTNSGSCTDYAGNPATAATVNNIDIDKDAPVITGSAFFTGTTDAYTPGSWTNQSVDVSFDCLDSGSGIATDTVDGDTTVSGEGEDQSVTSTGECTDNAGNSATAATVSDIDIEKTKPIISFTTKLAGTETAYVPGTWTNQSVDVAFSCADTGAVQSGIAGDTVVGDTTLTAEGANQSVTSTGACADHAGNAADAATAANIDIDKTKPVLTATTTLGSTTTAYVPGTWTNQSVVVSFDCTDTAGTANAGIDTANSDYAGTTLTASGENQEVTNTGECVDNAGNEADALTVTNIDIDKVAPVITGSAFFAGTTDPYTLGTWTNRSVTVSFSCADAGTGQSGIAANSVAGSTLTDSGEDQSVTNTGSCTDNAGNAATAATVANIDIDKDAPVITGGAFLTGTTDAYTLGTWTNRSVDVGFSCADPGTDASGLATNTVAGTTLATSGANQSVTNTGTCTDLAGNVAASATVSNIDIDKNAPTVSVTGFPNGATYTKGSTLPTAGCDTQDQAALSGVKTNASLSGPTGTGPSNPNGVGTFTYTCSGAEDNAGNTTAPVSSTYTVTYAADPAAGEGKILQPINTDNSSIFSRGRAVPVKFRLGGDEPNGFDTSGWTLQRIQVSCANLAEELTTESVPSNTPSTVFRYDATSDQYVYNADFKDKAAGTCWRVKVTLDDGVTVLYSAYFKLQK